MTDITVSKIDYYTWKVGMIIFFILFLFLLYRIDFIEDNGEVNDAYWHMGYTDCEINYNFTFEEMRVVNEYRISLLEDKK